MPLVGFRPTKARLVIEDGADSILVMKIALADGEVVELASGMALGALSGVLRIRRRTEAEETGRRRAGSLVYVGDTEPGTEKMPARYQINIALTSARFDAVLRVAVSGRLPAKFFIDAGERVSRHETAGLYYEVRKGDRVKVWNMRSHRALPVTRFTMILPIEVAEVRAEVVAPTPTAPTPLPVATGSQLVELVDELLSLHSETRYTILALVGVVGVVALVALAISLVLIVR